MDYPGEPNATGPMGAWLKRFLRAAISHKILPGPGIQLRRTSAGTFLGIDRIGGGGGKVNYRGTFDIAESYAEGDIIRSRNAPYALGVFICVKANPATNGACIPPEFPEPEDVDPDDENTWELISLGVKTYNACRNGQTVTVYINLMEV